MTEPTAASRGRGRGRGGGGRAPRAGRNQSERGSGGQNNTQQQPQFDDSLDGEDEAVRELAARFRPQLRTIQEIYPAWSTQDLLFTLKDANGDLETAISRISEGHAQQWDSVKSKKTKQLQRQQLQQQHDAASLPSAPSVQQRGAPRGRGERGGRGGLAPRGGRGRGGRTSLNSSTNAGDHQPNGFAQVEPAFAAPSAQDDAAASAAGNWGGWGSSSAAPAAPAAPETGGWGDEPVTAAPAEANGASESTETPQFEEHKPTPPPAKAPAARPVGATLTWAQIARPQEAPKPAVALPTPPVPKAPPVPEIETRPSLEEHDDEHVVVESSKPVNDPWASTPAASMVSSFPNQPLGVGEGWAETVLSNAQGDEVAANQQAYHHAAGSPNLQGALPPAGVDPAGPIEVADPADTYEQPTTELSTGKPVAAQLEDQVEAAQAYAAAPQSQQQQQQGGPPGFAQKPAAKAEPSSADRIGVQFGSLGLFDQVAPVQHQQQHQHPHQQVADQKPAARSPEVQERQGYSAASQAAQAPGVAQGIPSGPFGGYPQYGGAQGAQAQAGFGAFAGQLDQYQLHQQHQQQQQLGLPNGPAGAQRSADPSPFPGQQASAAQPASSASPYAPLGDTQQSAYFQGHHAGVPTSAAQQGQQQAQQIPSSYAAFHSVQAQQPQAQQYGQSDYSHLYGLQQRPGAVPTGYGGYANYSEQATAQAAQAAYGRQAAGAPDDKAQQQGQQGANAPPQAASAMGQQLPGAGYPASYGYPYYYGGGYGSPYAAPGYQQSPYAYQQFNGSAAMQGLGNRAGGYQQQQAGMNAGYRGNIPGPANYSQQGFYQAYPQQAQQQQQQQQQQQHQGHERDRSSYKNTGFSDF